MKALKIALMIIGGAIAGVIYADVFAKPRYIEKTELAIPNEKWKPLEDSGPCASCTHGAGAHEIEDSAPYGSCRYCNCPRYVPPVDTALSA